MKSGTRDRAALVIGTRGSALAMRQARLVAEALQGLRPDVIYDISVIRSRGDEAPDVELSEFEEQGVFVRRIEAALLDGRIDLAVHSAKDMPSRSTPGLIVAAFARREDPRDVLVASFGRRLHELPAGARIGTGSPRRRALLLDVRPDLLVQPIRGNVETRLRRVSDETVDAAILAAAGLRRLGREDAVTEYLEPSAFVPAVGQGTLAVQVREEDRGVRGIVGELDDVCTHTCAVAERAVAIAVGAGCQTPVGAYARDLDGHLELSAFLIADDGRVRRVREVGQYDEAEAIGARAGHRLTEWGA